MQPCTLEQRTEICSWLSHTCSSLIDWIRSKNTWLDGIYIGNIPSKLLEVISLPNNLLELFQSPSHLPDQKLQNEVAGLPLLDCFYSYGSLCRGRIWNCWGWWSVQRWCGLCRRPLMPKVEGENDHLPTWKLCPVSWELFPNHPKHAKF